MHTHLVLFRLRRDLSPSDREAFVLAFEAALRDIPAIRSARVGRRVTFGAGYETEAPNLELAAVIDFEGIDDLQAYLRHPAHQELGARFNASVEQRFVFDYEMKAGAGGARELLEEGR
jgi:hypothetical protein